MEIGFTDVLLIMAIGVVGILMFRRKSAKKAFRQTVRVRRPTQLELEKERVKKARRLRLRILAGALLIIGVVILLGATGILRFVTMAYVWAGTLIIGGVALLLWSTRR
jgi:hypothetical protein